MILNIKFFYCNKSTLIIKFMIQRNIFFYNWNFVYRFPFGICGNWPPDCWNCFIIFWSPPMPPTKTWKQGANNLNIYMYIYSLQCTYSSLYIYIILHTCLYNNICSTMYMYVHTQYTLYYRLYVEIELIRISSSVWIRCERVNK